jgi:membrane protease YdiL (CAAX protease family)
MAAGIVFALGPLLIRLASQVSRDGYSEGMTRLQRLPIWAVLLAIIVGAVCEELLYRAVAWPIASDYLGGVAAAFVVSALFGLAHWPLWGRGPALSTAVAGLGFTAAYALHGDLLANIMAHAVADVVGLLWPRFLSRSSPPDKEPP